MKLKKQNLLAVALLGFGTTALHAGQIWDGGSTGPGNDNWTTAANWDGAGGGVLPNFANAITFAGNTRNSPINDRTPDLTIGGINFTNDGSAGKTNAFTLSGARITLGGDITTTANTAGTTITDTISLNMILNGNRTILTSQQSASVQHNLEISGDISESGGSRNLAKNGAGMLILSGNNSYSGTTSIGTTGSILRIKSSTALGTTAGGVTLGANRALEIDGSGGALNVGAEAITVAGTGVSGGGAIRNIAGNNTWGGTVTLSGGTRIHSDSGTLLFNNATAFTSSSDRGLVVGGESNVTISGAITTGAGGVTKDGNGTLTLSGNNSYTGDVIVNGGTLVAAVSGSGGNSALGGSLSTKTINVNTGGTLRFDVGNVFNNNFASLASALPTLNIAGGIMTNGGAATNSALGNITLTGGTLTATTGSPAGTASGQGYGSWNLNGTVTSTGTSLISSSAGAGIPITLNATNGLSSPATIFDVQSGTLTVSAVLGQVTRSGNETVGSLTKDGAGTMILSGTNTYTGDTLVNAGDLTLATTGGMKFVIGASGVNNKISGDASPGNLTLDGTFTFDLTGAGTTYGNFWNIVDLANLGTVAFDTNFNVADFSFAGGGLWNRTFSGTDYQFSTTSGVLTVIPEPTSALGGLLLTAGLLRRRRKVEG